MVSDGHIGMTVFPKLMGNKVGHRIFGDFVYRCLTVEGDQMVLTDLDISIDVLRGFIFVDEVTVVDEFCHHFVKGW